MRKYRFHILGLVHLPVTRHFMACAFTQKIYKMCKMMKSLGHEVILYGAENSDETICDRLVVTHSLSDIRQEWGEGWNLDWDSGLSIGYDWEKTSFRHDFNSDATPTTEKFFATTSNAISATKKDSDFLLLSMGQYQKSVADSVGLKLTCEPGIGYRGSWPGNLRAFESAYLQNFTYGSEHPRKSIDGKYLDRVIPNYFEEEDFHFQPEKDDYCFYIGRMITRKGVWTAVRATEKAGVRLILAGQRDPEISVESLPPHCEFVGHVGPQERASLMGHARLVFVPTVYLEAFGGVNVEAQLCGTPVATTSFGVFPETVQDGKTGFLCNTLDDFVQAIYRAERLDSAYIRQRAERYLTNNIRWEYQRWFDDIFDWYRSVETGQSIGFNRIREELPPWRKRLYPDLYKPS